MGILLNTKGSNFTFRSCNKIVLIYFSIRRLLAQEYEELIEPSREERHYQYFNNTLRLHLETYVKILGLVSNL